MKIVKVMIKFSTGVGHLESPRYYEVSDEIAHEMAKYKRYYHFMDYWARVNKDDVVNIFKVIENPDLTLDFREDFKVLDMTKTYDNKVLSDYIKEISNQFDKYGNKLGDKS